MRRTPCSNSRRYWTTRAGSSRSSSAYGKAVTPGQVEAWSGGTSARAKRIRRVVAGRGGINIPHTDSLLETLAVQLLRRANLPMPTRQHPVFDPASGRLIAHLDLSWPDLGVFLELDGQQHDDQPVYDARRQTEVTVITGWRCGRLTWDDVTRWPESTSRLLAGLLALVLIIR